MTFIASDEMPRFCLPDAIAASSMNIRSENAKSTIMVYAR